MLCRRLLDISSEKNAKIGAIASNGWKNCGDFDRPDAGFFMDYAVALPDIIFLHNNKRPRMRISVPAAAFQMQGNNVAWKDPLSTIPAEIFRRQFAAGYLLTESQ
jgi:hypothetical protein